jgi:hypothetical protein
MASDSVVGKGSRYSTGYVFRLWSWVLKVTGRERHHVLFPEHGAPVEGKARGPIKIHVNVVKSQG